MELTKYAHACVSLAKDDARIVIDPGTLTPDAAAAVAAAEAVLITHEHADHFDEDVIATGFPERTDPNALVIGPTGVALAPDGTLYVADTQGNRIAAIPDAPFRELPARHGGFTVSSGGDLNGPLGMTLAPNGDILTANGDDGNVVETTPAGAQTDVTADNMSAPGGAGVLFGLTVPPGFDGIYFVDDGTNTLNVLAP